MLTRWLVHQFTRQLAERAVQELASRPDPPAEDTSDVTSDCRVTVVFALPEESAALVARLGRRVTFEQPAAMNYEGTLNGRQVMVLETGVGRDEAARRTEQLVTDTRPDWVVVAGFAAGLNDELLRGHLVVPTELVDVSARTLTPSLQLDAETIQNSKHLHGGRLLTTTDIVRGAERKRQYATQFDAVASDMESFAVAQVCRECETRFVVIRVISDVINDPLPEEIDALLNQKSLAGKLGAAVRTLVDRPTVAKDLWKLKQNTQQAAHRLATFLAEMLPQLGD